MNPRADFGRVTVNQSMDHPGAAHLPYPTHKLVGVLSSEYAARSAIDRLKSEGIGEDQMELFFGEAGASCLHSVHENTGLLGHLRQITGSLGPEREQSEQYENAIANGKVLLAVKASEQTQIDKVSNVLVAENTQWLRYYGRLAIRDLS